MNFKKFLPFFIFFVVVLGLILVNSSDFRNNTKTELANSDIGHIKIAGQTLKVELALTDETRSRGLSGRSDLKEDEGLLFVFDYADKYSFWMKDMNFPIDIIWIGEDLRVVYIKKEALPLSYPENFSPSENAKYVLEVVARFSEKNNLAVGDSVQFLP